MVVSSYMETTAKLSTLYPQSSAVSKPKQIHVTLLHCDEEAIKPMINEQGRYVETFGRIKCDNGMTLDVKGHGDYYVLSIGHSDAITQRLTVPRKALHAKMREVDNERDSNRTERR